MKHLYILFILALFAADSPAQKPLKWKPLKGPNTSSSANQLLIGANNEIISVGKLGYYSTENDGASWEYHKIIPEVNCQYLNYLQSGLVVTTNGGYYFYFGSVYCNTIDNELAGVYQSKDHGITWKHILKINGVYSMIESKNALFISTVNIYANYIASVFESIDDGNSWTQIIPNIGPYTLAAATDKIIYFSNYGTGCFEWSFNNNVFLNITNGSSDTSSFILLSDDLILMNGRSILYTLSGNSKWDSVGKFNGLKSLTKGVGGMVYATANPDNRNLYIASSADQGKNWDIIAKVIPYKQGDHYLINYTNPDVLLYGNDTSLYLSRNKGDTWKEIGLPFDSISTVITSNDGRTFAKPVNRFDPSQYVYSYFDVQLSSDKGESWAKSEPAKMKISKIGKGINGNIIAIAPDSTEPSVNCVWTFDSTIPGLWKKNSLLQDLKNDPLIASDGTRSIYIGSRRDYYSTAAIYRSDDNGFSWENVVAPLTGNDIFSLDANTDGTVYFGSYSVMYRSDDRGATWVKLLPVHDIVKLSYIKTFGQTGVLLGTEGDGLLVSNDKGNSWARIDGKKFDTVTCIAITGKGEIIAGTNRGLWLLDSVKQSWTKVVLGANPDLYIGALDVAKNDDIYVGTYGSSVWIGTRNYNAVNYYPPTSHSSMQLSPNPTTGRVAITLEGLNDEQVRLELYDILGRKISTLLDGKYSGEIYFNTSSLPNGIYTFVLSGEHYKDEQKLLVQH